MSDDLKIKIYRVAVIALIWALIAVGIAFYDHVPHLYVANLELAEGTSLKAFLLHTYKLNVLTNMLGAIIGGLAGIPLLFYLRRRFRHKTFAFVVMVDSFIFLAAIYVINVIVGLVLYSDGFAKNIFSQEVMNLLGTYLVSGNLLKTLCIWFVIVLVTIFIMQVSDKFGQGVMLNFILGKYHKRKTETRIFMFLDLKSSTTVAERLGHVTYFNLLKDFYNDATDPILNRGGEIYQYVGDEVVVSWKLKHGLKKDNCIRCFFDIQTHIQERAAIYEAKYGTVPSLRAGYHFGEVTVGEIGVVKREIIFTGDVLNTTARIQAKCSQLGAPVLISEDLLDQLSDMAARSFSKHLGKIELRGREQKVMLHGIEEN